MDVSAAGKVCMVNMVEDVGLVAKWNRDFSAKGSEAEPLGQARASDDFGWKSKNKQFLKTKNIESFNKQWIVWIQEKGVKQQNHPKPPNPSWVLQRGAFWTLVSLVSKKYPSSSWHVL